MAKSTTVLTQSRKKPGPPATGKGTLIGVRLQPDLLSKLDEWRSKQRPIPTRPEAIRAMVEATFRLMKTDE